MECWIKEIEECYEVIKMKKENFFREEDFLFVEEKIKCGEEIKKLEIEVMEM